MSESSVAAWGDNNSPSCLCICGLFCFPPSHTYCHTLPGSSMWDLGVHTERISANLAQMSTWTQMNWLHFAGQRLEIMSLWPRHILVNTACQRRLEGTPLRYVWHKHPNVSIFLGYVGSRTQKTPQNKLNFIWWIKSKYSSDGLIQHLLSH